MNTFLLLALLFLGLASVEAATSTVCEGAPLVASCPNTDDVIKVTFVMYGRQDATTCPHASVNSATAYSCQTSNGDRLAGRLNGVNSITWSDNKNSFFGGDPCPNIYKYLTVEYDCVPSTKHSTFDFCEKSTITPWVPEAKIQCPPGKFIKVNRDASYYGRQQHDDMVCPYFKDHNDDANCMMATLNGGGDKIGDQCDGLNSCQFTVSNTWFGNDPCVNTYKYAHVEFDCEDPCCCSIEDDPRVTTFDGQGLFIDVDNGDQCDMVNTLTEVEDVNICRYKISVSFENEQPESVTVLLRVPGDGTIYQFHLPSETGDTFPATRAILVTEIGGLATAECTVPGCDFKISLDVGTNGAKIRIYIERGDPNLGACHGGLCGNCNKIFDDYVLRNGTDVSHLIDKFAAMKSSYCL